MELFKTYQKEVNKNRISFSMYWDEVGTIRFCTHKTRSQYAVKIRFGKDINHFCDEIVALDNLEERLMSLLSCRYVFIFGLGDKRTEVLNILNTISCDSGCYEPIIGFKDSFVIFPKLRYNDSYYIKYLLNSVYHVGQYQLLWASNTERAC